MSTEQQTILGLKLPTDPTWAALVQSSLEEILTDHAWCEQKAATNGISMIVRFSDKEDIVAALAPVITEEWGHFRMVLAELQKRGYRLGRQRKDNYVNALIAASPKDIPQQYILLHRLLTFALIEARSCERFRILSETLHEESLRKFYHKFMVSEAGHYRLFIDLAENHYSKEDVRREWEHMLLRETEILTTLVPEGGRMH